MELLMRNKILSRSDQLANNKIKQNGCRPLALAVALAISGTLPSIAQADTFTVSNTNLSGVGSLSRAVFDANSNAGADNIEFSVAAGSFIIVSNELVITDSLTISGPVAGDAKSIILFATGTRHIRTSNFPFVNGRTLTLENITLINGTGQNSGGGATLVRDMDLVLNHSDISGNSTTGGNSSGGGIYVYDGNATLNHSTVSDNSTEGDDALGGGLFVRNGNATLNQSTISNNNTTGNDANGGGLSVFAGNATLNQSTISGNSTSGNSANGGGLLVIDGDTTITQSTISGNSTSGDFAKGGGLSFTSRNITLIQSTVSGNSTSGYFAAGGGLHVYDSTNYIASRNIIITQSTIVNNSSGYESGGISSDIFSNTYTTLTLTNSILSGNTGPEGNFDGVTLLNVNTSLFGDPLTEINGINNAAYYENYANLSPLQHNGGTTQTHKPNVSSNAVNTGSNTAAAALSNDQRGAGFPRIIDAQVDMGAVELQNISGGVSVPPNPFEILTRRDMAREILKKIEGPNYQPPLATGFSFNDVSVGDINADWIEEFNTRGFTEGCAAGKFCPDMIVTKEQMARVFIKAVGLSPPFGQPIGTPPLHSANYFYDVPPQPLGADDTWEFITAMRDNDYSSGCAVIFTGTFPNLVLETKYCPKKVVNREWFDFLLDELP